MHLGIRKAMTELAPFQKEKLKYYFQFFGKFFWKCYKFDDLSF